ncbi:MAG: hypothetical protein NTW50_05180 [Candidatus Berkelbacteria bacterium]|nr:hypothetical protein [Candidatus Berkelbacteria bacterium]
MENNCQKITLALSEIAGLAREIVDIENPRNLKSNLENCNKIKSKIEKVILEFSEVIKENILCAVFPINSVTVRGNRVFVLSDRSEIHWDIDTVELSDFMDLPETKGTHRVLCGNRMFSFNSGRGCIVVNLDGEDGEVADSFTFNDMVDGPKYEVVQPDPAKDNFIISDGPSLYTWDAGRDDWPTRIPGIYNPTLLAATPNNYFYAKDSYLVSSREMISLPQRITSVFAVDDKTVYTGLENGQLFLAQFNDFGATMRDITPEGLDLDKITLLAHQDGKFLISNEKEVYFWDGKGKSHLIDNLPHSSLAFLPDGSFVVGYDSSYLRRFKTRWRK